MRLLLFALAILCLVACRRGSPTLSGGKPVSHWVEELQDSKPNVRKKALAKLGNVGTVDPAALPAVAEALKDRDASVRAEAIKALVKFGPAARDFLPTLTRLQKEDTDATVRDYAANALKTLQPGS